MNRIPPAIRKVTTLSAWTSILCALWLGAMAQADYSDDDSKEGACGCTPEAECLCFLPLSPQE